MKTGDLLLTVEEIRPLWERNPEETQGQYERALCRAQAAKVLAVLRCEARVRTWPRRIAAWLEDIAAETGLPWPKGDA